MREQRVTAVVGAQYGSEGKGAVVKAMAEDFETHVRTGGPNAGHTIWHEGRAWKMRSVPCGWVNPNANLVIGAGAVLDAQLLVDEVDQLEQAGYQIRDRLMVDLNAGIISHGHQMAEGGVDGDAHKLIGSTGEGVGACRMAKINRRSIIRDAVVGVFWQAREEARLLDAGITLGDSVEFLNRGRTGRILLEGTQGSGLSLTHGIYPFVTSHDTNAAQLCADAGLPPTQVGSVYLVARVNPIRVAGNSGPLLGETSWERLEVEPEVTTVTLKTRRVGQWDQALFQRAVLLNGPTGVVVTFLDYVFPAISGKRGGHQAGEAWDYAERLVEDSGVPLIGIGTGPDSVIWL